MVVEKVLDVIGINGAAGSAIELALILIAFYYVGSKIFEKKK